MAGTCCIRSDAIANSQDMAIYRSGRAGLYGDFGYNIPVANGSYNVTLHFAEIQYWNKGDRIFNVAINGAQVLTHFDILAIAAPRAMFTQEFPVTVTNGSVQIAVNGVYRRGLLNGIQIAPSTATPPPPAPAPVLAVSGTALSFSGTAGGSNPAAQTVSISNSGTGTLNWAASSNQSWLTVSPASGSGAGTLSVQANIGGLAGGAYTGAVTVNAGSAAGSPKTIAVTLAVAAATPPPPTNTQAAINVNCGGQDYTALDGTKWTGDYYTTAATCCTRATRSRTARIWRSTGADARGCTAISRYSIPVQNGSYTVTLHFAEIQYWNRGDRVFNVAINGDTVLSNFDILNQVAPRTAMTRQFPVTVTNGAIQIDFDGRGAERPAERHQIASSSSTPIAAPSLVLSGNALTFNATAGGSNPTASNS